MAFERRQFLTTKHLSDNGLLGKDREILIDKTNKRLSYCDEDGTLESMANVNELEAYATKNFVTNLTGDLANLITTDKSNLVAAINEAAQSGGGSGDSLIAIPTYDLSWTKTGSTYQAVVDPTVYGITSDYHKYAIALWCEIDCKATSCTAVATANGWTITIADATANPSGQQYGYLLIHKTNRQVIPQGGSNLPLLQCRPSGSTPSGSANIYKINKTFANPTGSSSLGNWSVDPTTNLYKVVLPTTVAATASNLADFSGYWEDSLKPKATVGLGTVYLPTLNGFTFPLGYKLELSISNGYLVATIWASAVPEVAQITTANINLIIFGANQ